MLRKSYIILFIAALLLLVLSFYSNTQESIRLNVKDTYYVASYIDFYRFYSFLLMILGVVYLVLDKAKVKLVSFLSILHVYGTLFAYPFLLYFNYYDSLEYQPADYSELFNRPDYNGYLIITLLTLVLFQLLFIINIFVSIIKKLCN